MSASKIETGLVRTCVAIQRNLQLLRSETPGILPTDEDLFLPLDTEAALTGLYLSGQKGPDILSQGSLSILLENLPQVKTFLEDVAQDPNFDYEKASDLIKAGLFLCVYAQMLQTENAPEFLQLLNHLDPTFLDNFLFEARMHELPELWTQNSGK